MKVLPILTLFLACTLSLMAQAPEKTKAREIEDVLKGIPTKDFLGLRGNGKEEAAMEISKKLMAAEVNKETTFEIKITEVAPFFFPGENINGWRIHSTGERIRSGGTTLETSMFVHVRQDPKGVLKKIRPGATVKVTGTVTRCDVMVKKEPKLNIDMRASDVSE